MADLKATSRDQTLAELAAALPPEPGLSASGVEAVLREREDQSSTAVQEGVAIPHGRLPGLKRMVISFGRSRAGIPFAAPDHQPTRLFFLLLVPSDAEPFGRVAIEAMALGKPVVGTRAGGRPEVVRDGETGLLVVPRFPESLAQACLRVLQNGPLARSLGQAGRARVESCFHIDQTVRETQALYDAMLHPPLKWIRPQ